MSSIEQFKKDVFEGLSDFPKHISSKYFYDAIGDDLFVKITQLPEYYLTRAENEIFDELRDEIIAEMNIDDIPVEIIELGAGDGHKAVQLLEPLKDHAHLTFIPIDISTNALSSVEERFQLELPEIEVKSEQGEYFSAIRDLNGYKRKVVLFLGSNIGNFTQDQAQKFMSELSNTLDSGDKILLGVDLKKSEDIILPAYNDSQGVTRDFNLNLLVRINRELGGDFNLEQFEHIPEYDTELGEARSFIKSKSDQVVHVEALKMSFGFKVGELIQTEISQKYDDKKINYIIENTDLTIKKVYKDKNQYFADYLFEKS